MSSAKRLQKKLRTHLSSTGNAERAAQQRAYMKSSMPYAGLTLSELRSFCRDLYKSEEVEHAEDWLNSALTLWDQARVREERYAALMLLEIPRYRKQWYDPSCLTLYRHLITTGAWWDYVDNIASNHVGQLWLRFGNEVRDQLEPWINDEHLWLRRTTILAQLKFKDKTDLDFLHRAMQGSIADTDFFARKAIGWALRAYSYTDPAWVTHYIDEHQHQLSPLSVREGLKVIKRKANASGSETKNTR